MSTLVLRLFIKARPLLLRWAWPTNEPLINISKQGHIDHSFKSEWCYLNFFGTMIKPSNGVLFHLCIFLTHDFFDVAASAACPHGVSLREVEGTDVGVDSPWFLQLCIHVLEQGLMLEVKGNPRNINFCTWRASSCLRILYVNVRFSTPSVKINFF